MAIIQDVVYQHAENVCSLWMQRQRAVDEPHHSYSDLLHLDKRLEVNLDGMRIASEAGDPMLESMEQAGDAGACFARALLALERGDRRVFRRLVEAAESCDSIGAELESALAWVAPQFLRDTVRNFLQSSSALEQALGLRACAAHGRHPGGALASGARHDQAKVRIAAFRTATDLGDCSLLSVIADEHHVDERERYERTRAMAFLGNDASSAMTLRSFGASASVDRSEAVNLLMLMPDSRSARALLKRLNEEDDRARDVVRGFGLLGDPVAMSWLIDKSRDASLARLAGHSITMITGVDLTDGCFELKRPPRHRSSGPNDDPADDNVLSDDEENLTWPDASRLEEWWASISTFTAGTRYLAGREKRSTEMEHVLRHGMQCQRHAAALSLALAQPNVPLLDTRMPTSRQDRWMRRSP